MQRLKLEVSVREAAGRSALRKLRAQGAVPAVLYGTGVEALSLVIDGRSLERVLRTGANTLLDLRGPKEVKGKLALLKEVQRDPVSQRLLHCDVYAVDAKKKLHVSVPFHFEGRPRGVEQQGGIFETPAMEIDVSCLPFSIPDKISIDVSNLEIGDTIHLRDIELPKDVEALADGSLTVAQVSAPRVEAVAEPEAPAEGEEAAAAATEEGATPAPTEEEAGAAKPAK
ncbi:MAG: 50S ribosomal protein L25 [Myxococcales bacterium]|nr:50S ribosomal protein L25 [Myxococcales bacterium]